MSGRLHRMMLHRKKPVTGNDAALRDLTIANGLVRRGRRVDAERKFRAILTSLRASRTPEDTQAKVEAMTGLCDASVFAARSLETPVERFWLLLRGLCFLRRAKAHLSGPEAASMRSPHDGIDGKARGALAEAFRVLRTELLEAEEEGGLEEEGRRFLDDFFQFCANERKRKALLRPPKDDRRRNKEEAIKAAIFGAAPPPSKEGLHWLAAASPLSVSCLDLTNPPPPPPPEEMPPLGFSSACVRNEVQGNLRKLKRRVAASVTMLDRLSGAEEKGGKKGGGKGKEAPTDRLKTQRRQREFLETSEGQSLIEREADKIVAKLEKKRSASLEQLNVQSASNRDKERQDRCDLRAPLRRAPSLLDTSLATMHKRGFTASDSCLLGLSGGRSKRQASRQMRRQSANSAILERRAMRRSMRGSLQSLDKIGRSEAESGSGFESSVSRYRQIRLMRQLVGFEDGDMVREERLDADGNILEEEEEEEEDAEEKRKKAEEEEEAGMEEEPKVAQLHAEWIYTLVRFGNRLFEDGSAEHAALILRHALFLFEMLEKGVVEPQMVAGAMRRLGKILCAAGDAAGGVAMLDRALGLYAELPNEDRNRMAQAEVLLELGAAHMSPVSGLRLARRAIAGEGGGGGSEAAMAAFGCYKRCGAMLDFVSEAKRPRGFRARLLARLADCFVVLGDAEAANQHYERALQILTDEEAAGLVEENAHILSMLAIGRVLAGRPAKALAVLETAYILLFHRSMDALSGRAEQTGHDSRYLVAALLALCYSCTDQPHKALSWGSRALAFFEAQFGANFSALEHSEDAWMLAQLLLSLGAARAAAGDLEEAAGALQRVLEVCGAHLPEEGFLPCAALKALADLRAEQRRPEEALQLYGSGAARLKGLQDPQRFAESFRRAAGLQRLVMPSAEPHRALHDDLVAAAVALQFKTAVEALQQRNHPQAVQLLSGAAEFYREAHGTLQPEMVPVLGQLALSLHAAFLTRPGQVEAARVDAAFRTSLGMEFYPSLALKFAVFLLQQEQLQEAMDMCESVLLSRPFALSVVYEDHEEVTLPQVLLRELSRGQEDCVEFPALSFTLFLLYMAYKRVNYGALMDDVNAWLWGLAARSSCPMTCCLCAYVLMDSGMFAEAAEAFMKAGMLQGWARQVTRENITVCLLCQLGPLLRLQAIAAALLRFAPTANCH